MVSPSGKALDCKSFTPQFKSECHLYGGCGEMVDTTDLKSVDLS